MARTGLSEAAKKRFKSGPCCFAAIVAPVINSAGCLWACLKRHALVNHGPYGLSALHATSRNRLKSAQKHPSIIAWMQTTLWRCHE